MTRKHRVALAVVLTSPLWFPASLGAALWTVLSIGWAWGERKTVDLFDATDPDLPY